MDGAMGAARGGEAEAVGVTDFSVDAGKTFYLACSINIPGEPLRGVVIARKIAAAIERTMGWRCTSRWFDSRYHYNAELGALPAQAAAVDMADIARADCVVAAPLTPTSRGCHVEIGIALGLDRSVYLYRVKGRDPTAFDYLCAEPPASVRTAIESCLPRRRSG